MDPKLANILLKATREYLASSPSVMTSTDIVMPTDIQFEAGDLTDLVKGVYAMLSSYQPKKGFQEMNKNALALISFFIAVTLKNQYPQDLALLKHSAKLKTAPVLDQNIKPTPISDVKQEITPELLVQEVRKPAPVVDVKEELNKQPSFTEKDVYGQSNVSSDLDSSKVVVEEKQHVLPETGPAPTPHYYIRPKTPFKSRREFAPIPGPVGRSWRMSSLLVQEDDPDLIPNPVRHRPKHYPMTRPLSQDDLLDESWYSTQKKARRFYRGSKRRDTYKVVKYGLLERVLMKELLLVEHDTFAKHFVSDCML